MGKPIIKKLESGSFLDGSVVYENDARIRGEIEGNIETSDLSEPKSLYSITVGPLYYGPDSNTVPADFGSSWATPQAGIIVFQAPRDMAIKAMYVFVSNDISLASTDTIKVGLYTSKATDGMAGAYLTLGGSDWGGYVPVEVDGEEATGLYSNTSVSSDVSAGDFVRIVLMPGGSNLQPQAEVVVTMLVEEDHAE